MLARVIAPGVQRPAFVGRPSAVVVPSFGIGGVTVVPQFRGGVTVVRPQRRIIVPQSFGGIYSPYLWSDPFYSAPPYVAPTYATPVQSQNDVDLSYQVQRLTQEVEQLRQERSAAASQQLTPSAPSTPYAPERPATPTILVFRDGHRITVQNYAIIGEGLWVLEERISTKISLSQLDLAATQSENRSQGVRFPLPRQ